MIGQTIAQYEIVEKLGEGGMGIVYKARDSRLDRFVALKVLPPECVADPDRKRRFVQEAKAASALNHPNIITIHDIISAEGFDFIVMEFVAGKPLDHVIGRAPKGLEPTLDYGIQIADALVKAHAAGIVHRDLKPANVMLTPDGLVKLLDFGLAKLLRPDPGEGPTMTMTGGNVVAGTLSYMSPEQLRGEGVDERTDIWAVGAVLYELATGRRPFEAKLATALAADIQTKPPVLPRQLEPEIPPRFEEVILKCLEKDPERRYQSAKELRVDLARLREPSAVTVAPPAPRGLTWGAFRIGAAAVAAVLAVVFIVWLRPQAPSPTLNIRPVTSLVGMEWGATFSPDASLMAYAHNRYGHMDVFVVPTSGGGDPVRVTNNPADELTPRWSPDGRHLVFISDRGLGASVYLTSPLGGPERRLADTHLPYLEHSSQVLTALGAQPWSADATELLFSRLEPTGAIAIWKIYLETGSETQLTRPAGRRERRSRRGVVARLRAPGVRLARGWPQEPVGDRCEVAGRQPPHQRNWIHPATGRLRWGSDRRHRVHPPGGSLLGTRRSASGQAPAVDRQHAQQLRRTGLARRALRCLPFRPIGQLRPLAARPRERHRPEPHRASIAGHHGRLVAGRP
jgi:predicted Ser/Thr protein kinase